MGPNTRRSFDFIYSSKQLRYANILKKKMLIILLKFKQTTNTVFNLYYHIITLTQFHKLPNKLNNNIILVE